MANLLTEEEIQALLDPERFEAQIRGDDPRSAREATPALRGELPQLDLVDVLETVRGLDTEGVLLVVNPLEEHSLWIRDGYVSDWVPSRLQSRRLGQRLVRAGLLSAEQVAAAVERQEGSERPLGELLLAEGIVTAEQVDEAIRSQAAEDIYSLFVWTSGTVEFREGPPGVAIREALADSPAFTVDEILEEVARREADWRPVLESLGGVDEILVPCGELPQDLGEEHEMLLRALNGRCSLRDVSQTTMLGLFDCALALKDLCDRDIVQVADAGDQLELAKSHIAEGDNKRAVVILRNLARRQDPTQVDVVRELADLLFRCNDNREAGELLIKAAKTCDWVDERLELARAAYSADPRSTKVLSYLREHLWNGGHHGDELLALSCALADALAKEGRLVEALEIVAPFPTTTPDDTPALTRRVRILCQLDRREEAIEELRALAALCKKAGHRDRLAKVYKQILRIDAGQTDVVRALQSLRTRKHGKAGVRIVAAVLLASLGAAAWLWYERQLREARFEQWRAGVKAELIAGSYEQARRAFEADPEMARHPGAAELGAEIDAELARTERNRIDRFQTRIAEAARLFDGFRLVEALTIYRELAGQAEHAARTRKIADNRVDSLAKTLIGLAEGLPAAIPDPPSRLDSRSRIDATLAQLRRSFSPPDLELAKAVLAAAEQPIFAETAGEARARAILAAARRVVVLFERADARRQEYEAVRGLNDVREQLEGLWLAARRHEEKHEIKEAHDAYDRLAREYPASKDGLRDLFAGKRDRYRDILRDMALLAAATEAGDLAGATDVLALLQTREPEIPFAELVLMPVQIESVPSGATITFNGHEVGKTPALLAYRPAAATVVRIERPGFEPVDHRIEGERRGLWLRAAMVKRPTWTFVAGGVVERSPTFGDDGTVVMTDRSGNVSALELHKGQERWSVSTGDLSGLLPTPVLWRDQVVLTSLDGMLRSLRKRNGAAVWDRRGLPCEGSPTLVSRMLVAATRGGELVALDLDRQGAPVWQLELPGEVTSGLRAHDSDVFSTTANGWLVCADAQSGKIRWRVRTGSGSVAAPCVVGPVVAAADIEGRLVVVKASDGEVAWQQEGLGELLHAPVVVAGRVVVPVLDRLLSFDLRTGEPGPTFDGKAVWSTAPIVRGDALLVGDRSGLVAVLDGATLELRHNLRGGAAVASLAVSPDGWVVAAFEDRGVYGYAPE